MPTLQEMIAAQSQKKEPTNVESGTPVQASAAPKFGGFKRTPVAANPTPAPVPSSPAVDSASASAATTESAEPAVTESTATSLTPPSQGAVGGLARLAALTPKAEPQNEPVPESGVFSLADIEDSESMGTAAKPEFYTDMVPAEMPPRELPPELSQGQQEFIELVSGIYTCMNDPQMFGNVIRSFMQELQQNNEYDKLLVDADVNAMMAGLRSSMGMSKIKKQEKAAPRAKKAAKTSAMVSTLDDMFDDSDFE